MAPCQRSLKGSLGPRCAVGINLYISLPGVQNKIGASVVEGTPARRCVSLNHDHLSFTMESLAQELLEAIIDYVPPPHADSCSLVARRWRKRSQRRYFSVVLFCQEEVVVRWCKNNPQDPNGIPSYAEDVKFQSIRRWRDSAVFTRALKCFSCVKTLLICDTWIPSDEAREIVSSGEFGRELTSLVLISAISPLPALMPLILSFPNLRELTIDCTSELRPLGPIKPGKGNLCGYWSCLGSGVRR